MPSNHCGRARFISSKLEVALLSAVRLWCRAWSWRFARNRDRTPSECGGKARLHSHRFALIGPIDSENPTYWVLTETRNKRTKMWLDKWNWKIFFGKGVRLKTYPILTQQIVQTLQALWNIIQFSFRLLEWKTISINLI